MGKERETEREQVKEKREREAARNTVRYQSSQWSFDSGRGGARVRKKPEEKGSVNCLKRGSVIYRDPHIEGRVEL